MMHYYLGTKKTVEARKQGKSVFVVQALAGDIELHRLLLRRFIDRNTIPMDKEELQYVETWLEQEALGEASAKKDGRPKNEARDFEISLKVHEKIQQGLTNPEAYRALNDEGTYPIGVQSIELVYGKLKKYLVEEHMPALPQLSERMNQELDREMRDLNPKAVNEALDLIEDDAAVGLPKTRKRLKELEKATATECNALEEKHLTLSGARLHKMYWHGVKGQTAFTPPLWNRYSSELIRVVEKRNGVDS